MPTLPRPEEALVRRNPFRGEGPRPLNVPPFAEAQALLPAPELPERPEWVEMYWRAWEIAWGHLRRPRAGSGLIATYLDAAFNDHLFMGDSAFMMHYGLYGRRAFPFMTTLDNFYGRQHEDGFICREIEAESGDDCFYPFDPNSSGPNILAWAEWRYYRATGDDSRLPLVFWPLAALQRWFRRHRTWPGGLYWATGLSSATDNQPRVPDGTYHHGHWTWVDANLQAALNCQILGQMATQLGEGELADEMAQERSHLQGEINERLWNTEAAFYQDVDPAGRFSPVKSIAAYWALLDRDLVPKDRLEPFVRHLREVTAFKRPHRVPSQSADSPGYDAETGDYWRGAVWSPTNYVALKGLRQVGQPALAHEIAMNHLEQVGRVFRHTDTFWENYAPEAAAAGQPAKPNFVGWTGLSPIAMLLEDVIGVSVDWPLRRVTWDRRLGGDAPYGVRNLPLGADGALTLLGDAEQVTVTTDVPFTLVIQDAEGGQQTAVAAGVTEIVL